MNLKTEDYLAFSSFLFSLFSSSTTLMNFIEVFFISAQNVKGGPF